MHKYKINGGALDGAEFTLPLPLTADSALHHNDGTGYIHSYVYRGVDFDYDEANMIPIMEMPSIKPHHVRIYTQRRLETGTEVWVIFPRIDADAIPEEFRTDTDMIRVGFL